MAEQNQKPRIPSVELRKLGVNLLRLSAGVLVLSVVGAFLEWFHWTLIIVALAGIAVAYAAETILNALADMSEKIDWMVGIRR